MNTGPIVQGFSVELLGLAGIGKSTIGGAVASQGDVSFLDTADLLVQVAGLSSHDDILQLPSRQLAEAVAAMQREVQRRSDTERLLLELHNAPRVGDLGYRVTNPEVSRRRRVRGIVVVRAAANAHRTFRASRGARRDSEPFDEAQLLLDQEVVLMNAVVTACALDVPLLVLENQPGHLQSGVDRVASYIRALGRLP